MFPRECKGPFRRRERERETEGFAQHRFSFGRGIRLILIIIIAMRIINCHRKIQFDRSSYLLWTISYD